MCNSTIRILITPVPRHAKALFSFSVTWHWCNIQYTHYTQRSMHTARIIWLFIGPITPIIGIIGPMDSQIILAVCTPLELLLLLLFIFIYFSLFIR